MSEVWAHPLLIGSGCLQGSIPLAMVISSGMSTWVQLGQSEFLPRNFLLGVARRTAFGPWDHWVRGMWFFSGLEPASLQHRRMRPKYGEKQSWGLEGNLKALETDSEPWYCDTSASHCWWAHQARASLFWSHGNKTSERPVLNLAHCQPNYSHAGLTLSWSQPWRYFILLPLCGSLQELCFHVI